VLDLGAVPAPAGGFCAGIEALIAQARAGFPGEIARPAGFEAAACRTALQPGGKAYFCAWEYPYRADAATSAFARADAEVLACIGDRATMRSDRGVNHPDSYAARQYRLEGASVTVSLKDKAQLGRSFVFLKVSTARQP